MLLALQVEHGAETRLPYPLQGSGLATNRLVREGVCESLQAQVVVPRLRKADVLIV
jgi:hypothetical protein